MFDMKFFFAFLKRIGYFGRLIDLIEGSILVGRKQQHYSP
jgi:hypothetical protein